MPISIDVRHTALTDARRVSSSPSSIASLKVMRSIPAVTTRPPEWRTPARPATESHSFMTSPPWTKPAELRSVGPSQCTRTESECATGRGSTGRGIPSPHPDSRHSQEAIVAGMDGRTSTVIKAKINKLLDKAEDPGETLEYSYQRQMELLQNVKKGIADVVTSKKRLQLQQTKLEQQVVKLDTQARQALSAGNEDLARTALERKQFAQGELQSLDQQVAELEAQQQQLIDKEQKLRGKLEQFRTKKEVIKAQYSAAEAQVKISEAATGVGEEMADIGMAMQRAQDKTENMRARAAAMDELEASGAFDDQLSLTAGQDDIDRQLHELSSASAVDDDLARLRAELGQGTPTPQALGAGEGEQTTPSQEKPA